jgi:hypothetical protein
MQAHDERDGDAEELQRLDERAAVLKAKTSPVAARCVGWVRSLPAGTCVAVAL